MSIKALIKNQTIMIDDHHRGAGEEKNWDDEGKDIHIDKKPQYKINGKIQEVRIRLPINSDRELSIEAKTNGVRKVPEKLKKEIKKAFKDTKIRNRFIRDLRDILENFSSTLDNHEKIEDTMSRFSNHFKLNWTGESITTYIDDVIKKIGSIERIYTDNENNPYYFLINRQKIQIADIDDELRKELIGKGFKL